MKHDIIFLGSELNQRLASSFRYYSNSLHIFVGVSSLFIIAYPEFDRQVVRSVILSYDQTSGQEKSLGRGVVMMS